MNHYSDMMAGGEGRFIDFRSDTVTQPSAEMKQAAMECPLGDDVYGEDPTANALEAMVAKMLGKQAALFLPTGSMSNLVALLSHCGRGEEILVGDNYHIYRDEARGASVLGGIALDPLKTNRFGAVNIDDVVGKIKPNDSHCAITKLLCLENTVAGCVQDQDKMDAMAIAAKENGLKVHLDGARLFNAVVAQKTTPIDLVKNMDSVSICLSKGIGAPVGSVLAGSKSFIEYARRQRKMLGGGMRQIGILAACGIYGLENNIERLAIDHNKARRLAEELSSIAQISIDLELVQTNTLYIKPDADDRESLTAFLRERNILLGGFNPAARAIIHMDINDDDIDMTIKAFKDFYKN
ncbi:MAG: low-specificity L-threonine aldolase [Emcibacteraceae bacterium]|nr:low-specificity L-threonine aldolase [Emcibacteraceae bacterium]